MPSSAASHHVPRRAFRALTFVVGALCVTGCATSAQPSPPASSPSVAVETPTPSFEIPVVRNSRYTLVELVPGDDQRDLMRQVIDITIPAAAHATVGDALQYVLQRSGYRLCDTRSDTSAVLYALPLPAAHEHLGPVTLRDALDLLAGSHWDLQVDDSTRRVCFVPLIAHDVAPDVPSPAMPSSIEPSPLMDAAPVTLPLGDRP